MLTTAQQELNVAMFKAAVTLFDRLKLEPTDGTTGEDVANAVSRLFVRYANFLTKVWETTRYDGNVSFLFCLLCDTLAECSLGSRRRHLGEIFYVEGTCEPFL